MKGHIVDVNRKCNRYHNTSPLSSSLYPIILCASPSMPDHRHSREGALHEKLKPALRNKWQQGSATEVQQQWQKTMKFIPFIHLIWSVHAGKVSRKAKTTRAEKVKLFHNFTKWIGQSENLFIFLGLFHKLRLTCYHQMKMTMKMLHLSKFSVNLKACIYLLPTLYEGHLQIAMNVCRFSN